MTPPRILFVARAVNPYGGIPRAVFETIKAAGTPERISVAAIDCHEDAARAASWIPVPRTRLPGGHFGELAGFLSGTRHLPDRSFDMTVGILGESLAGNVASAHFCYPAWRRAVLPVTPPGGARLRRRLNPAGFLQWAVERRQAVRARMVIAVSEGLRRDLVAEYRIPSEKTRVIHNGVDGNVFSPAGRPEARSAMSRQWNAPEQALWLLLVASYDPANKGLGPVLSSIARNRETPLVLWVAGNADPAGHYKRMAESLGIGTKVRWLGYQTEMAPIYRACDVYLHPAVWESFPLAALEAAASGLPIIATRVSGMTEILADGENGFFVTRDADDIARRIGELAGSPSLRARMGEASRERASRFTWKAAAEKWLALAGEIASTSSRP